MMAFILLFVSLACYQLYKTGFDLTLVLLLLLLRFSCLNPDIRPSQTVEITLNAPDKIETSYSVAPN